MYQELTRNYHTIAKEVGIKKIIPVGNAFQLAEETPEWKFARDPDFDYSNPIYPELPKEPNSLNGGFAWRGTDGTDKVFKLDGSHANGAGSYLAACVWYEFFFGGDVRKITRNPRFLGERAASLREFAHQAVNGTRPKAWPSGTSPEKTTPINQ